MCGGGGGGGVLKYCFQYLLIPSVFRMGIQLSYVYQPSHNLILLATIHHLTFDLFPCAVWDKIKDSKSKDRWTAEQEEEFEDTLGNVVTKKTYEDLRRQGLL